MSENLQAFAEGLRAGLRAFNAGDFQTAFAGLSPTVQWHSGAWVLEAGVLDGRDAVIAFYRGVKDAGDWQVEVQDLLDAGDGRIIVHQRGRHVGRTTKIEGTMDFFQVLEIGADGLIVRVHEYESRDAAFAAVGLAG